MKFVRRTPLYGHLIGFTVFVLAYITHLEVKQGPDDTLGGQASVTVDFRWMKEAQIAFGQVCRGPWIPKKRRNPLHFRVQMSVYRDSGRPLTHLFFFFELDDKGQYVDTTCPGVVLDPKTMKFVEYLYPTVGQKESLSQYSAQQSVPF